MVTLNQLIKKKRKKKLHKNPLKALKGSPQKKGVCVRVYVTSPKKPNSALRKIAKVRLKSGRHLLCGIPGQGHSLGVFSVVLIRGGRLKDVPGVRFKVIRGPVKYDCGWVERIYRRRKLSKYGYPKDAYDLISDVNDSKKK